jgi:serine/threonine-protein kinase
MLELEQAREVTRKALDLDPSLGEAHSVLAQLFLFHDWNWAAADREARRAIALNEGSAPAHVSWAVSLVNLGRYDEAVAECRRAVELDPLWARGHQALQFALVQAGRHAESIAVGRKLLELEPDFVLAHITLAFAFVETGAYENAERSCEAAFRSAPAHPLGTSVLVRARVQTGQMSEARRCLENFLHADGEAAGPGAAAIMYGYLGEPDEAFRYLERAIELRDEVMVCLPTWTFWNPLRSDPRFEALLRRLNFPQYSLDAHFARLRSELGSRESAATPLP